MCLGFEVSRLATSTLSHPLRKFSYVGGLNVSHVAIDISC